MRKIVFIELNEVPWNILDRYAREKPGSHLAKILPHTKQYETIAADNCGLSPWITWPTVHRGVANDQHGIHHLGQDLKEVNQEFPPIWEMLSRGNVRMGVCGSLHTYPLPDDLHNYDFYLPDTFAATPESHPSELVRFQDFNLTMARASGRNVSRGIPIKPALSLAPHLASLGIKATTLFDIGVQLGREVLNPIRKGRRRIYQTVLAFDVFMKQLNQAKPDFSTFFTNHVASSMHRYWAASFPEDYESQKMDDAWIENYQGEINFAMDKFDLALARLVDFVHAHKEYLLIVASSMGQAAIAANHVRSFLTITDLNSFAAALGLTSSEWKQIPTMVPDFSLHVSPPKIDFARKAMRNFSIDGKPVDVEEKNGVFHFTIYHENYEGPKEIVLGESTKSFEAAGLGFMQHEDEVSCTAYHVPEGSLFIYDPENKTSRGQREKASTIDIAPTFLKHFSLKVPGYMKGKILSLN